jgi:hypothetical protein
LDSGVLEEPDWIAANEKREKNFVLKISNRSTLMRPLHNGKFQIGTKFINKVCEISFYEYNDVKIIGT